MNDDMEAARDRMLAALDKDDPDAYANLVRARRAAGEPVARRPAMSADDVIARLLVLMPKVTQGAWFYNGYAAISAADLIGPDDAQEWPEGLSAREDELWYRQNAYHQTEPRVASVPPVAGDTATGRHAADAQWIETLDPPSVRLLLDEIDRLRTLLADPVLAETIRLAKIGAATEAGGGSHPRRTLGCTIDHASAEIRAIEERDHGTVPCNGWARPDCPQWAAGTAGEPDER